MTGPASPELPATPVANTTASALGASGRVVVASEGKPPSGSWPSSAAGNHRNAWPTSVSCTRKRDSAAGVQRRGMSSPNRRPICEAGGPRKQTSDPSPSASHFRNFTKASPVKKTSALRPRITIW